jgi:hypothetical protein
MPATSRPPNFALLLGLTWLLIVCQLLVQDWANTARTLLDTDDAMRLTQMHDWLAGRGWYDLLQPRVEPPHGLESHWSRLIDAGLAGTLWVFGLVFDPVMADRLMRTVWPMLWLLPTLTGTAAIAWRIAGRDAALIALLLALIGLPAFLQFRPGRIDHHNVQIALSLLAVAATVWSDRVRWAAYAAGAVTGLALAIGLECLPYLIACGAIFAVRYVLDRAGARAAADYGLALAASSVAAFFVIVAPAHWTRGLCDAIAINLAGPLVVGGLGLWLAGRGAHASLSARLVFVLAICAAATALFVFIEPRCLGGPYAMMDPAIWPIWLAYVTEMQSLLTVIRRWPSMGAVFAAFPLAALAALLVLARERDLRGDFGFLASAAVLLIAIALTVAAVKMGFYVLWFAMPIVAAAALRLFERLHIESLVARAFMVILLAPAVLSTAVLSVGQAAVRIPDEPDVRSGCFDNASYAPLARLPAGLVAADIDFGPFLLALTPHSVLAAPYHRLSSGIIAANEAFASPPADAERILSRLQTTYVVTCGLQALPSLAETRRAASLATQLQSGAVPAWLELLPGEGPIRVYRLRPAG